MAMAFAELRERPEELHPGPELRDVVGRADEQPVGGHNRRPGHQPPQLPHLPPHRRRPPATARAQRPPPPGDLHAERISRAINEMR